MAPKTLLLPYAQTGRQCTNASSSATAMNSTPNTTSTVRWLCAGAGEAAEAVRGEREEAPHDGDVDDEDRRGDDQVLRNERLCRADELG